MMEVKKRTGFYNLCLLMFKVMIIKFHWVFKIPVLVLHWLLVRVIQVH